VVPLLGLPLLLLPVHLVWLELVVHPLAALVFEGEASPRDVMRAPPRDPEAPILPRRLALRSAVAGLLLTLGALGLYVVRLGQGVDVARSGALAVLILGSLTLTWAERALDQPWHRVAWPRWPRFWIVTGLILASLPALTLIPQVARTLQLAAVAPLDLLIAAVLAVASVAWRWRG
jgi:Ca2+-transporting ATPase